MKILGCLCLSLVLMVFSSASVVLPDTENPAISYVPVLELRPAPISSEKSGMNLSVEQAVFQSLQNNRDLQVQQLAPVIAGTFEQMEMGQFDPKLFAEFSWARQMDEKDVQDRTLEARTGITKQFVWGTTVTTDLAYEKDSSEQSGSRHNTRAALSVTQALLQGRGAAVNLAGVRQREFSTLASVYELKGFIQSLVAETEKAYWRYVLALKEIEIFRRSVEVAAQQRDEVEEQIAVGLLPENEAAAARAEEAIRQQGLINAVSLAEERRLTLLYFMGSDRMDTRITPASRPAIHTDAMGDTGPRISLALASRPDLKEAELKLARDELEILVTKNGILPKLDFFMNLGINGFGSSPGESVENLSPGAYDIGAGISVSRSLNNRESRALHRRAQAIRSQAEASVENLRHHIRFRVSLAVNETERARQQILASRKTREYEEQTVFSEQERFKVGSGTSLLVARAQRDLLASQIEEVRSVINYRIALVNLFLAEGSLLERRGISLEPDR